MLNEPIENALVEDVLSVITPESVKAKPSLRQIFQTWWPLTLSWLMIIVEGPLIVALAARLPDAEINLAALGGIVRAMTFAIESPILMLLTASATLSKDIASYRRLRTYALWGIGILTVVHIVLTLTPAYYFITENLIRAPAEIIEPGRIGMMITIPYLAFVAYRRFNHGVLIRFGYSRVIAVGTFIRLASVLTIMAAGLMIQSVSGVVVAALTMTVGVAVEAIFIELRVRPVLRNELRSALIVPLFSTAAFLKFYIPLAATSMALFVMQPVISAVLSRMPDPILSLAVWPPVIGIVMLLGSPGTPIVEVVVTFLDHPAALSQLRRFTFFVTGVVGLLALAMAITPLSDFWFGSLSALKEPILGVAQQAFWFALLFPVMHILQGFYQGILTYSRQTRRVTEAVFLYALSSLVILVIGAGWGGMRGAFIGLGAISIASVIQTAWMWWRSQPSIQILIARERDT